MPELPEVAALAERPPQPGWPGRCRRAAAPGAAAGRLVRFSFAGHPSVLVEALGRERARRGGLPARLDNRFAVHGRHGLPCPACAGDLRRVSFESHEVTYCPDCQTGGRVLADRRMSRLVRSARSNRIPP